MMGRTHALTGVLAATTLGMYADMDVQSVVLLCTSLPGYALLPDIDHANATVSRTFGVLTRTFSLVLGHRRETHSVPGIAAIAFGTYLACTYPSEIVSKVWLAFLLAVGWSATVGLFKIRGKIDDYLPILPAVGFVWYPELLDSIYLPRYPLDTIPFAVALGMLIHVVGDVITKQGCPLFWPFSSRKTSLSIKTPRWFRTWFGAGPRVGMRAGGVIENLIVTPLVIIGIVVSSYYSIIT